MLFLKHVNGTRCVWRHDATVKLAREPSTTKNSSSSRAPKTGAQLRDNRRSAKISEKPLKKPFTATIGEKCPSLLRTKMSTSSGDELNLWHFHCSRDNCRCMITATFITAGTAPAATRRPAQQGHRPPYRSTATAGPSQFSALLVQPQRLQLWDLDQFLTARTLESAVSGTQLGNLRGLLNWTRGNDLCAMTGCRRHEDDEHDATVGSRPSSHRPHPSKLLDLNTGTWNTMSMDCNWGISVVCGTGPRETTSAPRQGCRRP